MKEISNNKNDISNSSACPKGDVAALLGNAQLWYILFLSGSNKENKTGLIILNKKNRVEHRQSIASQIGIIKSK